ncbi:MAG: 50S ribosomal protein L11 methyltransferase [Thermodesulfobacteriota bacterium]
MNGSPSKPILTEVSNATLDARILDMVTESPDRLTPLELKRRVKQVYCFMGRGRIESSIKRLVEQKELVYTYQFGNSFLEASFERPVRVANSIVLKPPACDYQPLPGDIVVNIKAGAAFGTGCHPTTRLSLLALEKVCTDNLPRIKERGKRVLDIGTGSGVLAIAALKLGVEQGIGLDIDPCARAEASENAELNSLSQRMKISGHSIDSLQGRFFLIAANLRFPTLKVYFKKMAELTEPGGFFVVSGIKSNEMKPMKDISATFGLAVYWEGVERGWGGLALRR